MTEYRIDGLDLLVPETMLTERIAAKLASGSYETQEAHAARMRLRPGQRVLELGAGIGFIACLCARITGPENVTTVEANAAMLPVIRANLERNGFGAATLLHGAVAGRKGGQTPIGFDVARTFWAARLADGTTAPDSMVEVPHLGLDDLLESVRPQVVIMDIEGAEQHLFDAPWPGFVRAVMMELHPGRYPDAVIKRIVDCLSRSGLTYDPGPSCGRVLGFRKLRDT